MTGYCPSSFLFLWTDTSITHISLLPSSDKLVLALAILTGVFGALALILLVVLIDLFLF